MNLLMKFSYMTKYQINRTRGQKWVGEKVWFNLASPVGLFYPKTGIYFVFTLTRFPFFEVRKCMSQPGSVLSCLLIYERFALHKLFCCGWRLPIWKMKGNWFAYFCFHTLLLCKVNTKKTENGENTTPFNLLGSVGR